MRNQTITTVNDITAKYGHKLQADAGGNFREVETSGLLLEKELNKAFGKIQKMASEVLSKSENIDRKGLDSKALLLLQKYRRNADSALRMVQMFKK